MFNEIFLLLGIIAFIYFYMHTNVLYNICLLVKINENVWDEGEDDNITFDDFEGDDEEIEDVSTVHTHTRTRIFYFFLFYFEDIDFLTGY